MSAIDISKQKILLSEDNLILFQQAIENFNIQLLTIDFENQENVDKWFEITYAYSLDKINYSEYLKLADFILPEGTEDLPYFLCVKIHALQHNDIQPPKTLYDNQNVEGIDRQAELNSISYDSKELDLNDEDVIKFQTIFDIINQLPRWNLYDVQEISINRWKAQCNSIAESYGITGIYFKTEPIESKTIHTFKNHVFRNVVNIKKLHINFPNNELPRDINIYSDWDMPLSDEIICHIVIDKFIQAFGINTIPASKDYIYFPLVNKIFRVGTFQPGKAFMGQSSWWEIALSKFEDDETVTINDEFKNMMVSPEFDEATQTLADTLGVDSEVESAIFDEINSMMDDTLESKEKIDEATIEEKKAVTQNFTNKLVDSRFRISLKETDEIREYYDKRLQIVSINPDENTFPITMYDNRNIEKRSIAMIYNLTDFTVKNKYKLLAEDNFHFEMEYIHYNNYTGEVIDMLNENALSIFCLSMQRNKLNINDLFGSDYLTEYYFNKNELYNIQFDYDINLKQSAIKIFKFINGEKNPEYQNIYINEDVNIEPLNFTLGSINLFGGNFFSSKLQLKIDNNKIFEDNVNPLLTM